MEDERTSHTQKAELITEILSDDEIWNALSSVENYLRSQGTTHLDLDYGFVLDRDLANLPQGAPREIQISELRETIVSGLREGIIEFNSTSNFEFYAADLDLRIMICNDNDLHITSTSLENAMKLGQHLKDTGLTVYCDGKPI